MKDYTEAYRIDFSGLPELKPGPVMTFRPMDGGPAHEIFFEAPEKADRVLRIDKKTTMVQPGGSEFLGKSGNLSILYLQPTMEETIKNLARRLGELDPVYRYRAEGKVIICELQTYPVLVVTNRRRRS